LALPCSSIRVLACKRYGEVQQAVLNDPDMIALPTQAGQIATWETYASVTVPDM
jgi:hypothetical protein